MEIWAPTLDEVIARLRAMAHEGRVLVGIVGAPGSGKSTYCQRLLEVLPEEAAIAAMDGFHLDSPVLEALGSAGRKGAVDTFDVGGFVALLKRLRGDEPIVYGPRFDRTIETSIGSAVPIDHSKTIILVEGLYLLEQCNGWEQVQPELDAVWYLDVPNAERRRRLIRRRLATGESEERATSWVVGVDEVNAARVERQKERADVLLRPRA